jgi:chromate reductase
MKNAIKTLTLVGGISKGSLNQQYFKAIRNLELTDFVFTSFDISKLPFFSQDLEIDPPDTVSDFKEKIREAEAVLFITPEYNRSFPGVLKNAIDWGSRPYRKNLWEKKPAGILGTSPGNIGTFGAQHHLRQVLAYLDMHVLGQPEIYFKADDAFDKRGLFQNVKTIDFINKYFDSLKDLIQLTSQYSMNTSMKKHNSQDLKDSSYTN